MAVKVKMQMWNSKVSEYVIQHGLLDKDRLSEAEQFQASVKKPLEEILIHSGWIDENDLCNIYSDLLGISKDNVNFELDESDINLLADVNIDFLISYSIIPIKYMSGELTLAIHSPYVQEGLDYLKFANVKTQLVLVKYKDIELLKEQLDLVRPETSKQFLATDNVEKLKEMASGAPTVNLVNNLINQGLKLGASDLHLEPISGKYRARYRVDGILKEAETIPVNLQLAVISRIKILSGMDIAEKRRPQDGKIEMRAGVTDLDIRCSSLPLGSGESMVMRFLVKNAVRFDLAKLGYSADLIENINQDIKKTSGLILMTGPTGSGKTTSLYSFLNQVNDSKVKIITLEDPIEYQLDGVNQVQVKPEIGFDFSAGLRSIVRQDPDVIMVGEIRDGETAKIAMQSALTGHLVFSTVHTNDAPTAYTRLMELGVEEYLLNASLLSIMAQRLARKLCEKCKSPLSKSEQELYIKKYDLEPLHIKYVDKSEPIQLYKANGCSCCENTGFSGRVAILEYLPCNQKIKAIPKDEQLLNRLYEHMQQNNLRSLKQDGLVKALMGTTTIEEVLRVSG